MRAALALLLALISTPALADPCTAIPDRGPMPPSLARGKTFSGPVVYVGDGDSICINTNKNPYFNPDKWVEVRVADFYAPEISEPGGREAKAALERVTRGQRAVCRAEKRSHDRVVARCTIRGVSVGDLMRRAGIAEGGRR